MKITQKENGNILIELTPVEGEKYLEEHDVDALGYVYKNKIIDGIYDKIRQFLWG